MTESFWASLKMTGAARGAKLRVTKGRKAVFGVIEDDGRSPRSEALSH